METVKELVLESMKLLQKNGITNANFSRPHYPACIFYFGTKTADYHAKIMHDIASGWGDNTNYIQFYTIKDTDLGSICDTNTGEKLSTSAIQERLTKLLFFQKVFTNMSRVVLYCLVDTTAVQNADEFTKWYMLIKRLNEIIGVSTLSMLMVILNESLQLTETAKGIKNALRNVYCKNEVCPENTHLYDSLFVLSNRLSNGSFVRLDPNNNDYANYNLFANIVLLSNTEDADYNNRREHLYGNQKPAITVAYSFVQKPMIEIAMISLKILLQRLKDLTTSQMLDAATLMDTLKIRNGHFEIYDDIYKKIEIMLPSIKFVNWLPEVSEASINANYTLLNQTSLGCLQQFVEQNHLAKTKEGLTQLKDDIQKDIFNLLETSLSATQLNNGISPEVENDVFSKAELSLANLNQLPVSDAIKGKVKEVIADEVRQITKDALFKAVQQAQSCIAYFQEICSELERMFAVGEDGTRKNLISFYKDKISRYYSDVNKLKGLLQKIFNIHNTKSDMLELLYAELEHLFNSDSVFKLSFSEELIKRLDAIDTEKRTQEFIGQELIKNLNEKIGFFSRHIFRERVYEAYLLNTDETKNNLIYKYLSERPAPPEVTRTFFNTCNNDMAESIWFYVCSVDNLSP